MSGQFVDLFNARSSMSGSNDERRASMFPGSIASAAAQAQQRRRLSLSTVGFSGSPNQASPFSAGGRPRADSISSVSNSASLDESPFEEGDAPPSAIPQSATFGRRLSFGARAMRDMSTSNGNGNGNGNRRPSVTPGRKPSPPTASKHGRGLSFAPLSCPSPRSSKTTYHRRASLLGTSELTLSNAGTGQGYDFAETLRSRAERTSITAVSGPSPATHHQRAKSMSVAEPPIREMPKQPRVPDAIQERMLRGDFYMD